MTESHFKKVTDLLSLFCLHFHTTKTTARIKMNPTITPTMAGTDELELELEPDRSWTWKKSSEMIKHKTEMYLYMRYNHS